MRQRKRKRFDPGFKARVALDAVQERETLAQIGSRHGVHPVQAAQWKKHLVTHAVKAFESGVSGDWERREAGLLQKIGELTVERDFLARGLQRCR